jgi:hypothetical protein
MDLSSFGILPPLILSISSRIALIQINNAPGRAVTIYPLQGRGLMNSARRGSAMPG